ncbi:MAG TPA: YggS family pyridoxal phosphate-dependent enzyme, partial [Candidatus Aminicenantes bacterium]|nr:YggS family pyridoxal phosphate-dependent enzyme [Candidatus Aminicenantes bacterium]
ELIESVSSLAALQAIDRRAKQPVEVFLEINCGGEESKSGFHPAQLPTLLPALANLERVRITGLMTIPPPGPDSAGSRPYFRQLRSLQGTLNESRIPAIAIDQLSMGMSDDYPVAVEEGATLVRIGTALFGRRRP